jgi:hypothetical protein
VYLDAWVQLCRCSRALSNFVSLRDIMSPTLGIIMRKTAIRKPSLIISIVAYWLKDGEHTTFTKLCSMHQGHPAHMNIYEDVFFNFLKSDLKDCRTKTAIFPNEFYPERGFGVLAYTVVGERTA